MKRFLLITVAVMLVAVPTVLAQSERELPQGAKPGECYARVFVPAQYETSTERVLRQEESSRIEVVPATYSWSEERVMVKPESQRLEVVPAKYEWVEEKILVKPAQTLWKEGRGPVERINGATGEIMCLVEEPAVYKTVRKKMLKTPATTRTVTIPAEYKTVRVQKLASQPSERRVSIPAEYDTVTKRSLVRDGRIEWRGVLCETNMTPNMVTSIQSSLKRAGFDPGSIDGVIGQQTMTALRQFQKAKGLAQGHITMATLEALNVRASR